MVYRLFPNINQNYPIAGRLKFFEQNWKKLTGDPEILNIIRGWEIPLLNRPTQGKFRQYQSNRLQKELISEEVQDMLRKGAIRKTLPCKDQILSNIFLREKKEGTYRPIVNLKQVNGSIAYQKFKMESLKDIKNLLLKGDFMVKIDLKDAYFVVPLSETSGKFVRFLWEGEIYEFLCLMFGLGPAPRIFTKLMKVPIGLLRIWTTCY
jgi:hypothetical protein